MGGGLIQAVGIQYLENDHKNRIEWNQPEYFFKESVLGFQVIYDGKYHQGPQYRNQVPGLGTYTGANRGITVVEQIYKAGHG